MQVAHYDTCQDCGRELEATTTYRKHAYCSDCSGSLA
jgi:DNA-directed RNA polymerase subunit RPC12/RpoP